MVICDLGNSENAYLFVDCDLISASNPRATRVDWSLKGLGHVGKRDLIVYFVRTEQMWVCITVDQTATKPPVGPRGLSV